MKENKKVTSRIEKLCAENGVKFTHQRRIIAEVIEIKKERAIYLLTLFLRESNKVAKLKGHTIQSHVPA